MKVDASFLTAEDLRQWRRCARRYGLLRRGEPLPEGPHDLVPMAEPAQVPGPGLEAALRASFPGAVVIERPATSADWLEALTRTHAALADARLQTEGATLFGACLASDDGARVRIDVLQRGAHGWRVLKVRLATVGDEADVDEAALWAHVAARSGIRVQQVALLLVDTDFVYPGLGLYAGLFREVELAPVLGARPVGDWLAAMRACERPAAHTTTGCVRPGLCSNRFPCGEPAMAERLQPASLEVLGRETAARLRAQGHADLHEVPAQQLTEPRHRRIWQAVQQGAPVIEPAVADLLQALPYPRHFLRIDTIGFAVPSWPGTQPYQILPFQWTCDTEPGPGQLHRQVFLAQADGDPRRAFAQSLLKALGTAGPILAYNAGFERNRIRELALCFDDLAAALEALLPRIVDLFQVVRLHYYHPVMCGSWSFKSVCRALAPALAIEGFEVAGERNPSALFARSLQRDPQAQRLREALIRHGQGEAEALRTMVARLAEAQADEHA